MSFSFFFSGMGTAAFLISGIFFLKFWRASQDRFFAFLCAACWLFAFERMVGLTMYITLPTDPETVFFTRTCIYLVRLAGFITILYAVIQKNRSEDR